MIIKLLKTKEDHSAARERLSQLMDSKPDTPEGDELRLLATLIEAYEKAHYPLPPSDPIEAIKFRMDQSNLKKKDLIPYIGSLEKVNEVLTRKRELTLKMIQALHHGLGIPAKSLLAMPKKRGTVAGIGAKRRAKTA